MPFDIDFINYYTGKRKNKKSATGKDLPAADFNRSYKPVLTH